MSRKGEDDKTHFRSSRVESINGQWFFSVREIDKPIGPFPSQDEALAHAKSYSKDIAEGRTPLSVMSDLTVTKNLTFK
ncbi:MAG: DUF6316 family protein [Porticoccus sp.]|nr:DUF6316 family protein [Porticoccus sp.]